MDEGVRQLIYRSRSVQPIGPVQLREIEQRAAAFNQGVGVTGFLMYCSGHFVQLIEGGAESITTVLQRITADPRHADIRVVGDWHDVRRCFPSWSMSAAMLDPDDRIAGAPAMNLKAIMAERLRATDLPKHMRVRIVEDIAPLRGLAS